MILFVHRVAIFTQADSKVSIYTLYKYVPLPFRCSLKQAPFKCHIRHITTSSIYLR